MWPDGLYPQLHNPLKPPHAAPVLNLAFGFFQNARHLRHVIQSRSRESTKYNVPHILTRMIRMSGMTRGRWFFRCPQFNRRCRSFNFAWLMEDNGLSTPEAWSHMGLNTMRYESQPYGECGQSRENPRTATKLILHHRKENVPLHSIVNTRCNLPKGNVDYFLNLKNINNQSTGPLNPQTTV